MRSLLLKLVFSSICLIKGVVGSSEEHIFNNVEDPTLIAAKLKITCVLNKTLVKFKLRMGHNHTESSLVSLYITIHDIKDESKLEDLIWVNFGKVLAKTADQALKLAEPMKIKYVDDTMGMEDPRCSEIRRLSKQNNSEGHLLCNVFTPLNYYYGGLLRNLDGKHLEVHMNVPILDVKRLANLRIKFIVNDLNVIDFNPVKVSSTLPAEYCDVYITDRDAAKLDTLGAFVRSLLIPSLFKGADKSPFEGFKIDSLSIVKDDSHEALKTNTEHDWLKTSDFGGVSIHDVIAYYYKNKNGEAIKVIAISSKPI